MNKRKLMTLIVIALALIAILAGCGENSRYSKTYYANYGEWFVLPAYEKAEVKDGDGKTVNIESGKIFIDSLKPYTLKISGFGEKRKSKIIVLHTKKPTIACKVNMAYGVVGQPAQLFEATAHDGVNELPIEKKMFLGDQEIDISNGFIPQQTGEYTYVLSATGANNLTAKKEIPYYIEAYEDLFKNKIASFDKPFGVNQGSFRKGLAEYTERIKFEDEQGSTRLKLDPFLIFGSYEFILTNLNQADITKYDAFYFYAYNDTNIELELYFNWSKGYTLKPKTWTRIELKSSEYPLLTEGYDSIKKNLKLTDINGLNINILMGNNVFHREDSVYLSAIYGLNRLPSGELNQKIQNLLALDRIKTSDADNAKYYYSALSANDQKKVTNYAALQDRLIDQELSDHNVQKENDKILYFDHPIGVNQIRTLWGLRSYEVSDEKLYNDKMTLKVVSNSWDLALEIIKPYVYDISKYDALTFAIYNDTDKDLLLENADSTYKSLGSSGTFVLKAKQWNRVVIAVGDATDVNQSVIWIRPLTYEDKDGIPDGAKFYISPLYGANLDAVIDDLDASDYQDETFAKSVTTAYLALDASRKNALKASYDEFMNGYIDYLDGLAGGFSENDVLAFDKNVGARQIIDIYQSADISYATSVKYGDEAGSTKFTGVTSGSLELSINAPARLTFGGAETLEMYVYYQGSRTYALYFNQGNYNTDFGIPLISGQWTKITIPLNGAKSLIGYKFMLMDNDWKFAQGDTVYFSALKVK